MTSFQAARENYRARAERALAERLPRRGEAPERLREAMEYACLNGGKRFRAMLVYACGEAAGAPPDCPGCLDAPAAAVEMVHAYSLVHDDLPAMDDDDVRRGRPSCHIAYDQATAILAGDALQTRAFEVLAAEPSLPPARRLRMLRALGGAAGARGMAGGQMLDIAAANGGLRGMAREEERGEMEQLARIHRAKTGALITAAAQLGALAAARAGGKPFLARVERYAECVGLAFQIADDVLDVTASVDTAGKRGGGDLRMQKTTYASALGVEEARAAAREQCRRALREAESLSDNAGFLMQLARFAVERES